MSWNWQLPDWPQFKYLSDNTILQERKFLLNIGKNCTLFKTISTQEYKYFVVEILTLEGLESSKIEGEILDRESLQSSIKKHFALQIDKKEGKREKGLSLLLCDVYDSFHLPLTHEMLWKWHRELFQYKEIQGYRSHAEPMQIVSSRSSSKVYFEAPPSKNILKEMNQFINWFNEASLTLPVLERAAISHVYFESIHPFEDGNGRIGRLLIEKILSQGVGEPVLIAISQELERNRKQYYLELEKCNRTLDIQDWIEFFAESILKAQENSSKLIFFLIEKSKLMNMLAGLINERQEKVLLRMFAEGIGGFKGGLSAENYISITKTSRATATRDLADLVDKNALIKTGELRHTRYWLNIEPLQ